MSYHRAPSVTRHAGSIAGTSELTSTRVNKPENDDPSIVEPVELAAKVLPQAITSCGSHHFEPPPPGVMIDSSIADDQRQKSLNRCGDSSV